MSRMRGRGRRFVGATSTRPDCQEFYRRPWRPLVFFGMTFFLLLLFLLIFHSLPQHRIRTTIRIGR